MRGWCVRVFVCFIIVILHFQKLKLRERLHIVELVNGNKYKVQACTTIARMFECLEFSSWTSRNQPFLKY